jgi:DNA-binding transcriptional LysR family regulator
MLTAHGLSRRVALTVPTLAMALRAVDAGLVTVAPATLAGSQLGPDLRSWALPVPAPEIPAVMSWHLRHERDSAHRWLRAQIRDTLTAIPRAPVADE